MLDFQAFGLRRAILGGLAVLSIVAGSSLALSPQSAQAAESSRVLYREYFAAGSTSGELLRGACTAAFTAERYGVSRTEARVTWNVYSIGGVSYNQFDCIGYTASLVSPYRPIRFTR